MTEEVEGIVRRKPVAPGSKSEHDAVVLVTGDDELLLRRSGGNPFADPELDALVGRRLRCRGTLHGSTLILEEWDEQGGTEP
jgi:hypothetical protein